VVDFDPRSGLLALGSGRFQFDTKATGQVGFTQPERLVKEAPAFL
jgi:hypothetical protein